MARCELVEPDMGDKCYQRRNQDGAFGESDDQGSSFRQEVNQRSATKKPSGEGDEGD